MDRSHHIINTTTSPLLSYTSAVELHRSRHFRRHAPRPLRGVAARLARRAIMRRLRLRDPSVRVRESAVEELEDRHIFWAHSKPVMVLDCLWNLAFAISGLTVLGLSIKEKPVQPLRAWGAGYIVQCMVHAWCVVVRYMWRSDEVEGRQSLLGSGRSEEGGGDNENEQQGMDDDDYESSVTKTLETLNSMFSFFWWCFGFVMVTGSGQTLQCDSPHLYWLCVAYLAFDFVFAFVCVGAACLIGIAVCCCLPCIIAVLITVTDQGGTIEEEIDSLPKFKFRRIGNFEKVNGEVSASEGLMIECGTNAPKEHSISREDAECSICLSVYDNGAELRQLPCHHHFHSCIDKWLCVNATCPLCKFNILNPSSQIGRGVV